MKPTNQNIKNKSIREFAVIMGLCFFTVLTMSYFFFNTPQSIYKDSFDQYNIFVTEHNALKMKTASIATKIGDLSAIEFAISKNPDAGLDSIADNVTKTLTDEIEELKRDSINGVFPLHVQDISNYFKISKAVLLYFQNLNSSRQFQKLDSNNTTTTNDGLLQKIALLESEKSSLEHAINQLNQPNRDSTTSDLNDLRRLLRSEKINNHLLRSQLTAWKDSSINLQAKNARLKEDNQQLRETKSRVKHDTIYITSSINAEEKEKIQYQIINDIVFGKTSSKDPIEILCTGLNKVLSYVNPNDDAFQRRIRTKMKVLSCH